MMHSCTHRFCNPDPQGVGSHRGSAAAELASARGMVSPPALSLSPTWQAAEATTTATGSEQPPRRLHPSPPTTHPPLDSMLPSNSLQPHRLPVIASRKIHTILTGQQGSSHGCQPQAPSRTMGCLLTEGIWQLLQSPMPRSERRAGRLWPALAGPLPLRQASKCFLLPEPMKQVWHHHASALAACSKKAIAW